MQAIAFNLYKAIVTTQVFVMLGFLKFDLRADKKS